ncbi:hypothetical protein TNCV_4273031 [Trichonephila clavipes]|nr:hypothetical protein TNCV_4273031 [Trichonephila clavipes]
MFRSGPEHPAAETADADGRYQPLNVGRVDAVVGGTHGGYQLRDGGRGSVPAPYARLHLRPEQVAGVEVRWPLGALHLLLAQEVLNCGARLDGRGVLCEQESVQWEKSLSTCYGTKAQESKD